MAPIEFSVKIELLEGDNTGLDNEKRAALIVKRNVKTNLIFNQLRLDCVL